MFSCNELQQLEIKWLHTHKKLKAYFTSFHLKTQWTNDLKELKNSRVQTLGYKPSSACVHLHSPSSASKRSRLFNNHSSRRGRPNAMAPALGSARPLCTPGAAPLFVQAHSVNNIRLCALSRNISFGAGMDIMLAKFPFTLPRILNCIFDA